jgi:hypothetical protein
MEELQNLPPENKIRRFYLELHDFGVFTTPIRVSLEDAQGYFDICEKYDDLSAITLQDYSEEFKEEVTAYLLDISEKNKLLVGRHEKGWISNTDLELVLHYQFFLN